MIVRNYYLLWQADTDPVNKNNCQIHRGHTFLLPDPISFDQDEMVNSDEKNEELETSPPSDNDTLFNADNQKKKQKQNLKRILLSMIALSVVSLSTNN